MLRGGARGGPPAGPFPPEVLNACYPQWSGVAPSGEDGGHPLSPACMRGQPPIPGLSRSFQRGLKGEVEPALPVRERNSLETEPTVDPNGRAEELEVLVPIPERPGRARVYKPLVLEGNQRVAADGPSVLPGYEPIWKSLLYLDPLSSFNGHGYGGWAVDPNAGGFVEDEGGGIHYRSEAQGSAGFLAIEAASGDAIKAIAKVRGKQKPGPEDAETLVRYLTGLLEPWERKRFGDTVHRLEGGEIRDANGRPILRRTQPVGNPSNMADAIVDLALKGRRRDCRERVEPSGMASRRGSEGCLG